MVPHEVHWLAHAGQRLALVPSLGGGVGAWLGPGPQGPVPLWRSWPGTTEEPGALACFPMVPWCNRIGGGGFMHEGAFHALARNTGADPFPIHGNAWQRPWQLHRLGARQARMELQVSASALAPHSYRASQHWSLNEAGLMHRLSVCNTGRQALPFGLGLHPWWARSPGCRLQAGVAGWWRAGADKLPTEWVREFPQDMDLLQGIELGRRPLDHAFGPWDGQARIELPALGVAMDLSATLQRSGLPQALWCMVYVPSDEPVFCLEPMSHPPNAPHLAGQPGWSVLAPGEDLTLQLSWAIRPLG